MGERYLIDVIVPVYNGAAYIEDFFRMFARQADPKVRFLFVDDGSGDGSGALLEKCAAEYELPVKLLRQENAGVSAARNAGLDASDAEYVAFFDIDDAAAPDYIPALLSAVRRGDFDVLVFGQRRIAAGTGEPLPAAGEPAFYTRAAEEQLRVFLADPTRLGVYDLLVRRTYLEALGLRFPAGFRYYEDYDFLYRLFAQTDAILCTDAVLYAYLLREGSAMSRFDGSRLSCLRLMTDLEPWLAARVPAFADEYRRWGAARIYWSVLWQAAMAAPSCGAFRRFAERTHAAVWMKKLRGFPEKRVALSRRAFLVSRRAYYHLARTLGGRRTGVRPLSEAEFDALGGCPDPRRVLVYGMTDNPGGIESYLMGVFRRAPAGTFDFLCDFPAIAYGDELRTGGAAVWFVPAKSRSLFGQWRAVARVLREHPEYATVYFNVLDAGCVFTALIPWLFRRRIVVHSHNGDTDKTRLHRLCRPLLSLMTGGRATCSDVASLHMFGRTGEDILFIPNAVDAKRFSPDPARRAAKRGELGLGDRLAVLHVGRISRQKNPLFLIDIFAEVLKARPDAVLLSVGEGEMAEEFDAYIQKKGLEASVLRLGRRPDVPDILRAADVFLLPSLYEGLSIALLEAQAAGLPSVASDAVSPQTVVTDLVRRIALSEPPSLWAAQVLEAADMPRQDTYDAFCAAGFDVSCCADSDRDLMALLLGE